MKQFFTFLKIIGVLLVMPFVVLLALCAALAKLIFRPDPRSPVVSAGPAAAHSLASLVVLAGIFLCLTASHARAQAYFTNSTTVPGPYQYNQNYIPPYNASIVISNQVANGICTGTILPAQGGLLGSAIIVSNNFYCTYSTPPTVTASSSLAGTNAAISIIAVTKTAFILGVTTTNANTIYWQSIGH